MDVSTGITVKLYGCVLPYFRTGFMGGFHHTLRPRASSAHAVFPLSRWSWTEDHTDKVKVDEFSFLQLFLEKGTGDTIKHGRGSTRVRTEDLSRVRRTDWPTFPWNHTMDMLKRTIHTYKHIKSALFHRVHAFKITKIHLLTVVLWRTRVFLSRSG